MARKRQTEKDSNMADQFEEIGMTRLSDVKSADVQDYLPTMIPGLDELISPGGFPFGRSVELYAKPEAGKSTFLVNLTKTAISFDVPVIWIDVEGTTTPSNMESLGVDPDDVMVFQPPEGGIITVEDVTEKIEEIAKVMIDNGNDQPLLIIWDSLASTPAKDELQENKQLGIKAKSVTNFTLRCGQLISKTNICLVVVNQARDDLTNSFGYPMIKSTGGKAIEHMFSVRLELRKASQMKEKVESPTGGTEETYVGHILRFVTKKNKLTVPNRRYEVFLRSKPYIGVDFMENLYYTAVNDYGFISKGAWRTYKSGTYGEIKLRDKEWVPFLNGETEVKNTDGQVVNGENIAIELFVKEMVTYFPHDFAPLHNKHINIKNNKYFAVLDKVYDAIGKRDDHEEVEYDSKDQKANKKELEDILAGMSTTASEAGKEEKGEE